jgi:hypothetical protein
MATASAAITSGSVTFFETFSGENGLEWARLADATPPVSLDPDSLGAVRFVVCGSPGAAAPKPDTRLDASAACAAQTLLCFAVSSSVGDGMPESTITTVMRSTVPPPRVRALIRYVPLGSCRPRRRPLNGTLFRPGWPRTVKVPTSRHTGETCLTVKTTRAPAGSRNVRIVRRRAFGPCAAIHGRELRSREIVALRVPGGEPVLDCEPALDCELALDCEPELPEEEGPVKDEVDAIPPIGGADGRPGAVGTAAGAEGAGAEGAGGRPGSGGTVTDGAVTGGTVTAGSVGVGMGRGSANASPAPVPAARTAAIASGRSSLPSSITEITPFGPFQVRAK